MEPQTGCLPFLALILLALAALFVAVPTGTTFESADPAEALMGTPAPMAISAPMASPAPTASPDA